MSSKEKLEISNFITNKIQINYQSKDEEAKDKSDNKQNWITKLRAKRSIKNKLNFETGFNVNGIGTIELANYHKNSNRPLKKLKEFDQSTKFCPCCSLPVEQKGYLERFNFCDDTDEFIQCGTGISLYFSFFRFSLLILILTSFSICLPTFIITNNYTEQIMKMCIKLYEIENSNINNAFPECINFIGVEGISKFFIHGSGWALRFNGINLKQYRTLHSKLIGNKDSKINKTLIDYSFLYFLGLMTLFIINIFYIIFIYNFNKRNDMIVTTPSDYTAIISNLSSTFNIFWKRINKINNSIKNKIINQNNEITNQENNYLSYKKRKEMEDIEEIGLESFPKDKEINILEGFNCFIKNRICVSSDNEKFNISQINICYKIHDLIDNMEKIQDKKSKVLKIKYDPIQKAKNEKLQLKDDNRRFFYYPFGIKVFDVDIVKCNKCEKSIKLLEIEKEINQLEKKLNNLIEQSQNLTKENFSGVILVTFVNKKEKEKFLKPYPKNFIMFLIITIINLRYYLCGCFIHKNKRKRFFLKRNMSAETAPEPEEIKFENLETSSLERLCRTSFIYLISIIMIGISFVIISRLNILQKQIDNNEEINNVLLKYGLSLIITIVTAIINVILEASFETLTELEKHITMTNYYLSYSIKLTLFTFLTSSVIPLVSNYLYNAGDYDLLVTNMLVMFLTNSFVTPILWTINFNFFLRKLIQFIIEKLKIDYCTQKKLNKLYELPNMKISNKYSYIAKTLLMSFLYIPIFPQGIFISLLGFFLGYFLEKYNFINMYKKPEMLNSYLCDFYSNYFVVNYFMLGIGNYIFIRDTNENNIWPLVNINLFAILIIIPYNQILCFDFISIKESQLKDSQNYDDVYFNFYNDYERSNPMTKKEGMKRFLNKLKERGYINFMDEAIMKNYNNINLMETYYKSRQNFNNTLFRKAYALYDSKKGILKYKNFLKFLMKGQFFKRFIFNNALKKEIEESTDLKTCSKEVDINLNGYDFNEILNYNDLQTNKQKRNTNTNIITDNEKKDECINNANEKNYNNTYSSSIFTPLKTILNTKNQTIYNNTNENHNNDNKHIITDKENNSDLKKGENNYSINYIETSGTNINNDYITQQPSKLEHEEIQIEENYDFNEQQNIILNQYKNPFYFTGILGLDNIINSNSSLTKNSINDNNENINNSKKEN